MTLHAGENELAGASVPIIYNVTMTVANFEYSQTLPTNCRKFQIRPRSTSAIIKLAYNSGESGTTYEEVPPSGMWQDMIGIMSQTLYFQTSRAGTVAEIEAWN
jgi:hypothetical protein